MFKNMTVELTNACNMECIFCTHSSMNRQICYIDFNLFKNIIDQIVENKLTGYVHLDAIGEPLLYPRLLDAVEYCATKGLRTIIISNSILLTCEFYHKLSDKGLTDIYLSLHNLTENSYAYRKTKSGELFKQFYENIIKLVDYQIQHNISTSMTLALMFSKPKWFSSLFWDLPEIVKDTERAPEIIQSFINDMQDIAGKYSEKIFLNRRSFSRALGRLTSSYGLDALYNEKLKIMRNVFLNLVPLNPQLFNIRERLKGELGKKIKLVKKTKGRCLYISAPMILSNGSFIPCPIDGVEDIVVGKIDINTPLVSVINGNKYNDIIQGFGRNRIIHPVCQECRGRLVYTNSLNQFLYLIKSFSLTKILVVLRQKVYHNLWSNSPESFKNTVRKLLRRETS